MRQHLSLPNAVTSVSLAAGFAALLVASAQVALATSLVVLAAVLDGVDGALARRAGGDRTFGAQLDSLTDLLCFCVVPAFALQQAVRPELLAGGAPVGAPVGAVLGGVVAGAFLLAGAWRLARFPLVQQQACFVGLPTPAAGVLLMVLVLWAPPLPTLLGALCLAGLMASSLRFPTVLAAAAVVRPGRRTHRPGRRPAVLSRPSARPHEGGRRPANRRPGRAGRRAAARAGRVLRALTASGVRRRGRR